jgi:hypothetical protein
MTIPNSIPAWMSNDVTFPHFPSDAQTPPRPAWATHGEHGYASFVPETGTYERHFSTEDVAPTPELSVRLHQRESWDHGVITHDPLTVQVWGRGDDDRPFHLTAEQARALGLALLEHAARLREVQEGQA